MNTTPDDSGSQSPKPEPVGTDRPANTPGNGGGSPEPERQIRHDGQDFQDINAAFARIRTQTTKK